MIDTAAYFDSVVSKDAGRIRAFFHENAVIRWHNTHERFTADAFVHVNCAYPGEWNGEIERIETSGDIIVLAARVFSKDNTQSFHVVSFIRTEDDQIKELDEYWGDDGDPPEWRR